MHKDVGCKPNKSNFQSPLLWHSGWTTRKLCWLGCPRFHRDLRNRVNIFVESCNRTVSNTASHRIHPADLRCCCARDCNVVANRKDVFIREFSDLEFHSGLKCICEIKSAGGPWEIGPWATVSADQSSWECAVEIELQEIYRGWVWDLSSQVSTFMYTLQVSALTGAQKQESLFPSIHWVNLLPSWVILFQLS